MTKTASREAGPFTPEQVRTLEGWRSLYPFPQMGLIEAMRAVQGWHRRISLEAEAHLAALFGVPEKVVHEVATFYPYFTQEKVGRHRIAVCRNLSCSLAGAEKAIRSLEARLGVKEGGTTADGEFTLEAVECLGACEQAPAWSVNDRCMGRAEEAAISEFAAGAARNGQDERTPPEAFVFSGAGQDKRLLTRDFDNPRLREISTYRSLGGYSALEKARKMKPAELREEVKKSNLRGLGGAGFPTGMKWDTLPPKDQVKKPRMLVVNADESEPGCFKDRVLLERSPHQVIEGALITAHAIEADWIVAFIRGEYSRQRDILEDALAEARKAGLAGKNFLLMRGAGAYISGADTALMETMEGKKAWPRQPPPFPTAYGVMGCPTVVNNVETLAMLPSIVRLGGEAFAKMGLGRSGGTSVFSVSGHVAKPGIYEFPMGTPLKEIIRAAGGVRDGRKLKAVIPGGTSTPVLKAEETDVAMDFDSLRTVGSFLGAGGIIVLDETTDMVETLHVIERFLWHESCGQCTPCREGSGWETRILERVLAGGGAPDDLDNLVRISENVTGRVICALGDTVGAVAKAMISKFKPEFEARVAGAKEA